MPAPPSSPIDPAIGHLADLAEDVAADPSQLLGVLAGVADPRHRRGVRHKLAVILGMAVCAVLAGARSFTAIAEWAADVDQDTLRVLGAGGAVPSESTFRRVLRRRLASQRGIGWQFQEGQLRFFVTVEDPDRQGQAHRAEREKIVDAEYVDFFDHAAVEDILGHALRAKSYAPGAWLGFNPDFVYRHRPVKPAVSTALLGQALPR